MQKKLSENFRLELGELVRDLRRSRQMTQADLAGMVGVSRGYISLVETGRRDASASKIFDIFVILKKSPDLIHDLPSVIERRAQ